MSDYVYTCRNVLVVTFEDSAEPVKVCVHVCVHACACVCISVCICTCTLCVSVHVGEGACALLCQLLYSTLGSHLSIWALHPPPLYPTVLPTVPDSFSTYIYLSPPPSLLPQSVALQDIRAIVEHILIGPLHCHQNGYQFKGRMSTSHYIDGAKGTRS